MKPMAIKFNKKKNKKAEKNEGEEEEEEKEEKTHVVDVPDSDDDDDDVVFTGGQEGREGKKDVKVEKDVPSQKKKDVVDLADSEEDMVFTDTKLKPKTEGQCGPKKKKKPCSAKESGNKPKSSERKLYHSSIYKKTFKKYIGLGKTPEVAKAKARKVSLQACEKKFGY